MLSKSDIKKINKELFIHIALISLIASGSSLLSMYIWHPDFEININNSDDETLYTNETETLEIQVENARFREYDRPVLLQIWKMPAGISATISPEIGLPGFSSNLFINVSKGAILGRNDLIICGISSDGKNKYVRCKLNILQK